MKLERFIHVQIRDKIAKQTDDTVYVCGNSDYVVCFDFDKEWDEQQVKTARFISDNGSYSDCVFEGDKCAVPVMSNTYRFKVGVFAGDLHTTTAAIVSAKKSIQCEHGTPADPQPDVYAQIMQRINEIEAEGISEAQIAEAVNKYLSENPVQMEESDPTVHDWAKAQEKPKYTAEEVGAQPKGDYALKSDIPTIPEIPEPYSLPVASADTLGGVKVGEGLQMDGDVLGVAPEGEYELIETITVTEDNLKSIQRDIELNAVMVLAEFAKASKTTNAFLQVNFINSIGRVTGSNFMRADGLSSARFSAGKKNGYWDISSSGYVKGWGSGQYYGQGNAADVVFVSEAPVITSIYLYAADGAEVIPNGSVIKIMGVRANA